MKLQSFEQDGKQYFITLPIYKHIGTSSHQRLKEKAIKNGLTLFKTEHHGTALAHEDLLILLQFYVQSPKGISLNAVQSLLSLLSQPKENWLNVQPVVDSVKLNGLNGSVNESEQTISLTKHTDPLTEQNIPFIKQAVSFNEQSFSKVSVKWYETLLSELQRFVQSFSAFIKTEQFVFIVLFIALIIQINHVAHLFVQVAAYQSPLTWVNAYLFGAVAELTALLLTVHNGDQKILKVFAGLTFWVNLLYYKVWMGYNGSLNWFMELLVKITLSGFLAYVIYTYAHLFTLEVFNRKK